MAKIFIVEDDKNLSANLRDLLALDRHIVETVDSGRQALDHLRVSKFDIVILDWCLPDITGLEICQKFRERGGTTPILMLTGKDDILHKTQGFDAGADDYLTKPFHPNELRSRIKALLRRSDRIGGVELKAGSLVLTASTFTATKAGQPIRLLPKEFALLEFFMRHPNQVFKTDALIDRVWESKTEVSPEVVRTYINRLRNKIDEPGETSMIQTVHGIGYKLTV